LLWDIILTFSISDDESVRKSAWQIYLQYSDEIESFPVEILSGKVCNSVLETFGSTEALAVLFKVLKGCETSSACFENAEEEVSLIHFYPLQIGGGLFPLLCHVAKCLLLLY
jgi:hypothetical protein